MVSSAVVRITDETGEHGGTGFHVKAASGKSYIVTNAHVCELRNKKQFIYVGRNPDRVVKRKVLEVSKVSDLCLIESLKDMGSLSVASSVNFGEIVAVVGHPSLMGVTMTRGELIDESEVLVYDHDLDLEDENDCKLPKNEIVDNGFFGQACMISISAYRSNVVLQPGNSGSPLINFYGNVVGVAFAGGRNGWGIFVTLEDINKFLSIY